jgi:molybdate transport system ATP-binding protein
LIRRLEARLEVEAGEFRLEATIDLPLSGIAVIFGPSGAGKTTLLRAIAGIGARARGFLAFEGEVWQDDARGVRVPPHRRGVGFVFQQGRLFPHLSVRRNLLYGWRRTPPAERKLDVDRVFDLLEVRPLLERRIGALSGGERQRVAIGRALLASPRLLLMDEPVASVDLALRGEILAFVERLPRELGIPIVYVTHSVDEMLRLAERVVLVERGRTRAQGPVEELSKEIDLLVGSSDADPGTVFAGTVTEYDERFALARIRFAGGEIRIPSAPVMPGVERRVRVRSRDVSLSLDPPGRATILNVLRGTIREVVDVSASDADVLIDVGVPLRARVTRRSVAHLGLAPGVEAFALVKAVALETSGRS